MLTGICDSCGDATDTLVGVQRIYLVPVTDGSGAGTAEPQVMNEIEQWCVPCRIHYPHQVLEVDG